MEFKLPKRQDFSNKGTYGKVLNIAGSEYYAGAAYLSSVSALKIGCGYVALATSPKIMNSLMALCPDIVYTPITQIKDNIDKYNVVSIGCGLSVETSTSILFKSVISQLASMDKKVIIDADGLNLMAKKKPTKLPENLIKLSKKYSCTTVLKLHSTVVCSKDMEIYINDTGNSALSKAGSGDVLTGIISGLCAQGMDCFEAAKLGVYLHGRTGEIASSMLTEYSVLASDLIKYIPLAIVDILSRD